MRMGRQYRTYRRAGRAGVYIPSAAWPKTISPEVPGHISDERPPARLPAAADRRQRVLRRGRVRARAQSPRQGRAAGGGGGERRRGGGRAAGQDRRVAV